MINKYLLLPVLILLVTLAGCNDQSPATNAEVSEGILPLNGTGIYYKSLGSGTPLIVIHGGPVLDHSYLLPWLKPLSEDHRLIFYDQRLSGRSAGEVDSSQVRLKYFVDDIEALRSALGLDKVHLMAHSWGGLLAMEYALTYPEQLHSLVLMNSIPASSELWQEEGQQLARRTSPADSLKRQQILASGRMETDLPGTVEELLKLSFRNQFHDTNLADSLHFHIPEDYMSRSRQFSSIMPDLTGYDLHQRLTEMEIPTLLIYGSTEPASELSGPALKSVIPHAKLKIIQEAGHFPFVEQPDSLLNSVSGFYRKYNFK